MSENDMNDGAVEGTGGNEAEEEQQQQQQPELGEVYTSLQKHLSLSHRSHTCFLSHTQVQCP